MQPGPPPRRPEATLCDGTPDDAPSVAVLAAQVFLDTYATRGIRPELAREVLAECAPDRFAARLRTPSLSFILAEHDGHLVGFAELDRARPCPVDGADARVQLVRLYVQRPFQGTGIGALLIRAAEARAREWGAAALWLEAWAGNDRALAFYAARGYARVGSVEHRVEDQAYTNHVFIRELAPGAA
jgi:GNAT superfamily N-acetyltransferase